jgi:hypothetical protein
MADPLEHVDNAFDALRPKPPGFVQAIVINE